MSNPALKSILKKTDDKIFEKLESLSLSELNSMLMEVFRRKANTRKATSVMKAFSENRFVKPSAVDPLTFIQLELECLQVARDNGFQCLQLSPLAPFGSCSGFALADQNKIVTALRGTEVVSDATNVLALHAINEGKQNGRSASDMHLSAVHRHVRAQSFSGKGFSAHFGVFCAVSSGRDRGSHLFEWEALERHLSLYTQLLKIPGLRVKIILKVLSGPENVIFTGLADRIIPRFSNIEITVAQVDVDLHRYYSGLRFTMNVVYRDKEEYNIGDGGFVNWGEQLSGNKKERMLTSGLGTELLYKLMHGKL